MSRRLVGFVFLGLAIAACSVAPSLDRDSSSNSDNGNRSLWWGDDSSEGTTCTGDVGVANDAGTPDDGGGGGTDGGGSGWGWGGTGTGGGVGEGAGTVVASSKFTVVGKINEKYVALGGCSSFLGVPLGNEQKTPDGAGRYTVFTNGSIYWHPSTSAFEVHGAIRQAWADKGWEAGPLGYPTSDEYEKDGARRSDFQHGDITWVDGKTAVHVDDTAGQATYYNYVSGGACGIKPPADKLIAAINDEQYSKENCGKCAMVTGPKGSVKVLVLDKCPGCGWGDLDLSQQAFERVASTSAGRVKIGWHFVDCQ